MKHVPFSSVTATLLLAAAAFGAASVAHAHPDTRVALELPGPLQAQLVFDRRHPADAPPRFGREPGWRLPYQVDLERERAWRQAEWERRQWQRHEWERRERHRRGWDRHEPDPYAPHRRGGD